MLPKYGTMNCKAIPALVLILFFSCSSGNKRHIPRKDFIPLLVDLHVADAMAFNGTVTDMFGKLDSVILYRQVLEKHGVDKEQITATFNYYADRPEELMKVYDEVFATLSRMSEEAKNEGNKYSPGNATEVWRYKQLRTIVKGKEQNYPDTFVVSIDSAGTYVINITMKLAKEDSSINPRIVAFFRNSENDAKDTRVYFDDIVLYKSKFNREFYDVKSIEDTTLNELCIIIPAYDNPDTLFYKDMELFTLRVVVPKPEGEKRRIP